MSHFLSKVEQYNGRTLKLLSASISKRHLASCGIYYGVSSHRLWPFGLRGSISSLPLYITPSLAQSAKTLQHARAGHVHAPPHGTPGKLHALRETASGALGAEAALEKAQEVRRQPLPYGSYIL